MGMRWLITGGCGFLGVNLTHRLLAEDEGHGIVVLDDLSVGTRDDLAAVCNFTEKPPDAALFGGGGAVSLVVGDIRDADLALRVSKGADVIVHFAANTGVQPSIEQPRLDMEKNITGTFNYLEAARQNGVGRFVFASSGAPAGNVEPPIHEELAPHPVSPYGASKLAGEGYCSAYANSFGLQTVALRFGNVYGPRSSHKSSVVAKFIRRALAGEPLEIYGDGQQTRDFIHVDDLIEAVIRAATVENIGGETFQIATHRETTVREIAEAIRELFAAHGLEKLQVIFSDPLKGDVRRNFSDTSKAERMLGWKARVSLEEGLKETLEWFLARAFESTT